MRIQLGEYSAVAVHKHDAGDWLHPLEAGLKENISPPSFRATGITVYLENGGSLDHAQQIAAHEAVTDSTTSQRLPEVARGFLVIVTCLLVWYQISAPSTRLVVNLHTA